jgi:SAM-dependent methyltransferase
MTQYRINPYISFVESRLFPEFIQYAVFHRLTGELLEPIDAIRSLMHAVKSGNLVSLTDADLDQWGALGSQIRELIRKEFLIPGNYDPLTLLREHYVARPIQNPALIYRSRAEEWMLVRTSMEHTVYSRKRNEQPLVIEEVLSPLAGEIFSMADGTKTLRQIFSTLRRTDGAAILEDDEFRTAIDFLTNQERQLIKLTSRLEDLEDPFTPVNIVPRNLYHADRWKQSSDGSGKNIIDFHLEGIQDAIWEFDQIEPTVNHCFRFPHDALAGLDYGSRFCLSALRREYVPILDQLRELNVLEVGGGTGVFARSFIEQARQLSDSLSNRLDITYHILDLSPALLESQRKTLAELLPADRHFQQNATEFDIPEVKFDLIIANEVIADFPVAQVNRSSVNGTDGTRDPEWEGDGAAYLYKYDLLDQGAPDSFVVNAGAFNFIERAWKHLTPGGTLILSEYGSEHRYPTRSVHLSHDEFSIHFGQLAACAAKLGFQSRLLTLKEFMLLDDNVLVLNGREEHILCLNHVFGNYGLTLPYAVISKSQFEREFQNVGEQISLTGYSFSPLRKGYHFGPNINDFLVLIMTKPLASNKDNPRSLH